MSENMSVLEFVKVRVTFAKSVRMTCNDEALIENKEEECVSRVLEKIALSQPQKILDTMSMMECIQNSSFKKDNIEKIIIAITARTEVGEFREAAPPNSPVLKQMHNYFQHYMTKSEWESLCSSEIELPAKLSILVMAMFRCGWFLHTEGQLASVIAILRCVGFVTTGLESLRALEELKAQIAKRKSCESYAIKGVNLIPEFPENPKLLPQPWRMVAFQNGQLIESPVLQETLAHEMALTPCRRSHCLVRDNSAARGMPTDVSFEGIARMMQMMGMIQPQGGRAEPPTGFGFPAIMGKAEPQILFAAKPAANSSLFALADGSLERSESSASLEPPPQVDAPKSGDYQQADQVQAANRHFPEPSAPSALSVLASTKGFLGKKKPKPLEDRGGNGDSGSEPEQDDGAADLRKAGKRGTPRKPAKSSTSTSAKKPTREARAKPCNVKKARKREG